MCCSLVPISWWEFQRRKKIFSPPPPKFPANNVPAPRPPPPPPLLQDPPPPSGIFNKKPTPPPFWRLELPVPLRQKIKNIRNVHQDLYRPCSCQSGSGGHGAWGLVGLWGKRARNRNKMLAQNALHSFPAFLCLNKEDPRRQGGFLFDIASTSYSIEQKRNPENWRKIHDKSYIWPIFFYLSSFLAYFLGFSGFLFFSVAGQLDVKFLSLPYSPHTFGQPERRR